MTVTTTDLRQPIRSASVFLWATAAAFTVSVGATIYFLRSMSGSMNMPGGWRMSMMWMRMPDQSWLAASVVFLAMWLAMMVAMMLPSLLPMLLKFHGSYPSHKTRSSGLVALGYFLIWTFFGAIVYGAGILFASFSMRSAQLSSVIPLLSAVMLFLAGAFQFTKWKRIALLHCRDAIVCAPDAGQRATASSCLRQGLKQGLNCAFCCLGLMVALFAIGVMNPTAMIVIAVIIALEKLAPKPQFWVRLSGIACIFGGVTMVVIAKF